MIRSFARRISPVLVAGLMAFWLTLNQTLSPGHMVLGLSLAVLIAWAGSTLRPLHARVRRIDVAVVLALLVLADVARSNVHVARVVLGLTGRRAVTSQFLDIPLDLRDPHGLAALVVIITCMPGTVCVGMSAGGESMRLHVLDLQGAAALVRLIKDRYERRLMRIFE
jgi:multicomponent K+:H+ antiporter subunit E